MLLFTQMAITEVLWKFHLFLADLIHILMQFSVTSAKECLRHKLSETQLIGSVAQYALLHNVNN